METLRPRRLPTSERLRRGRPGNGQLFWWVWASGVGGFDEERHFYEGLFLVLSSERILPKERRRAELTLGNTSIILALVTDLN